MKTFFAVLVLIIALAVSVSAQTCPTFDTQRVSLVNLVSRIANDPTQFDSSVASYELNSMVGHLFFAGLPGNFLASQLPLPTQLGGIEVLVNDQFTGKTSLAPVLYAGRARDGRVDADGRQLDEVVFQTPVLHKPTTSEMILAQYDPLKRIKENQLAVSIRQTVRGLTCVAATGLGFTRADSRIALYRSPDTGDVYTEGSLLSGHLTVYATGLGDLEESLDPGVAPDHAIRVRNPVSVQIGDQRATVEYAGVSPGYPGLYQINISIPPPDGVFPPSVTISVTQGGVTASFEHQGNN